MALVAQAEVANRAQRALLASRLTAEQWRTMSELCERIYGADA